MLIKENDSKRSSGFTPDRLDAVIRFFLYVFIFWLPYSKAVLEICVIAALAVWIIKRIWLWGQQKRPLNFQNLIISLKPVDSPLNRPIYFFLLACFLSAITSFFWERAIVGFLAKTAEWFVIYFLVIEVFKEKKHIYTALGILLFTALATSFDSIRQYYWAYKDIFFGYPLTNDRRATAAFSHPNSLGGFMAVVIPVVFSGLFLRNKKLFFKFTPVLLILMIWSLVLSFSRASWLGDILGVSFFAFGIRKKVFLKVILIMCIAAAMLMPLFLESPQLREEFRLSDQNISTTANWRWQLWEDSLAMIKEKPFLGHGLNTFMILFQEYRGNISGRSGQMGDPTYAHNTFIQMTTETGILGLAMFLWIIKAIFIVPFNFIRQKGNEDIKIILLGCLSGILAFFIQSLADNNFYSLQLSSFFWYMVGVSFACVKLLSNNDSCGIKDVPNSKPNEFIK